MARQCTVCTSPRRSRIDAEIAGGQPLAAIATRHRVGRDAIRRHKQAHLSPALARVAIERLGEESAGAAFDATVDRIESLVGRLEGLLSIAEERKSLIGGANIARELRQCIELIAKLKGELDERPQLAINVLASPEVQAVVTAFVGALDRHPEIRFEVVRALEAIPDFELAAGIEEAEVIE